jgi:hypothetical protein
MKQRTLHTEDSKLLGATAQNPVATATRLLGFVHSLSTAWTTEELELNSWQGENYFLSESVQIGRVAYPISHPICCAVHTRSEKLDFSLPLQCRRSPIVFNFTFLMRLHSVLLKWMQGPYKLAKTVTFLAFRGKTFFPIRHDYFLDKHVDIWCLFIS